MMGDASDQRVFNVNSKYTSDCIIQGSNFVALIESLGLRYYAGIDFFIL